MKPVVIIPTLNECQNIKRLIKGILKEKLNLDILVVDGLSTDGTAEAVEKLSKKHPNVSLVSQEKRSSFGDALRLGFKTALQRGYDPILTMDGDCSHGPEYLKDFLNKCNECDLVIGSRYLDGVRVEGWRFRKLLLSKLANMYVSYLLVKPIWDFTSGFRCYRRRLLEKIDISSLHNEAYIIQIELLHLAYQNRCRVKEIPFIYRDTKYGVSKISEHSKRKTMLYVLKFRAPFLEIFRHLTYLGKKYERFVDEYEEIVNPPKLKNDGRFEVKGCYSVSVGVMAYNEEKIIESCLKALLNQKMKSGKIDEIIVVSSGSTDKTNRIVQEVSRKDERVKLIIEPERKGKANAINEFLQIAKGDIAIVESADTVTLPDTVEELIKPFADPQVGMSGAHPMPVNDKNTFVGFCVHKLWELHHSLALEAPKCGEMIAFRNIVSRIPKYTAVDEATVEAIISEANLKLVYAEKAFVRNKGAETLRDFIKQRRRIASGHRYLKTTMGHEVATQSSCNIFKKVIASQNRAIREMFYMPLLILIEAYSRFMGAVDFYLRDKNPFIWDISLTTKKM